MSRLDSSSCQAASGCIAASLHAQQHFRFVLKGKVFHLKRLASANTDARKLRCDCHFFWASRGKLKSKIQ
jgi:hypothetical protein